MQECASERLSRLCWRRKNLDCANVNVDCANVNVECILC